MDSIFVFIFDKEISEMGTLLLLAVTLSLDSLRASMGLGATKPNQARQIKMAVAFGICDGLSPLAGLLAGQWLLAYIEVLGKSLGPLLLGIYGIYIIFVTLYYAESAQEAEGRWIVWGIPLSLSLDNIVAGASLENFKISMMICVIIIGLMSGLMSLIGFYLANLTVNRMKIKTELFGGICLVLIALSLVFDAD